MIKFTTNGNSLSNSYFFTPTANCISLLYMLKVSDDDVPCACGHHHSCSKVCILETNLTCTVSLYDLAFVVTL